MPAQCSQPSSALSLVIHSLAYSACSRLDAVKDLAYLVVVSLFKLFITSCSREAMAGEIRLYLICRDVSLPKLGRVPKETMRSDHT